MWRHQAWHRDVHSILATNKSNTGLCGVRFLPPLWWPLEGALDYLALAGLGSQASSAGQSGCVDLWGGGGALVAPSSP